MTSSKWQQRREALEQAARTRSEQIDATLERRRGMPAAPGDLFVLPATSELPVEWAILDRRPQGSGQLLAVPADSHPGVGSADVAVEPEGTPVLRCRYSLWLPSALFEPKLRSGVLPAETVTAARLRVGQIEADELPFSPLGEEVDVDPEYRDWIREATEPARTLALAAGAAPARPPDRVYSFPTVRAWVPALAAALAVASIGLSFWVVELRRVVDELSAPVVNATEHELKAGIEERGGTDFLVPSDASHVRLVIVVKTGLRSEARFAEILRGTEVLWRSRPGEMNPAEDLNLILSRRILPDGEYHVRIYSKAGFQSKPLSDDILHVKSVAPKSP